MKLSVKYSTQLDTINVQTKYNTEVLAYNDYDHSYYWVYIADAIKSRFSGEYLVKDGYAVSNDKFAYSL